MSANRSMNVYLENTARQMLSWWGPSVVPLWRLWELLTERYENFGKETPDIGGCAMKFFFGRLLALQSLTVEQLASLLQSTWGETVDPEEYYADELVMKVLAYEGMWVDLYYSPA